MYVCGVYRAIFVKNLEKKGFFRPQNKPSGVILSEKDLYSGSADPEKSKGLLVLSFVRILEKYRAVTYRSPAEIPRAEGEGDFCGLGFVFFTRVLKFF